VYFIICILVHVFFVNFIFLHGYFLLEKTQN